jgi:hypothetical protein
MNLLNKIKQNKAQVSNVTIWIILALLLLFMSFFLFGEKIDMFNSMIGTND